MTITTSAAGGVSTTRSTAVAGHSARTSTSLVFVIPVYNEEENLPRLLAEFGGLARRSSETAAG